MNSTLSEEQSTILSLLSGSLFNKKAEIPAETDWPALFKEASEQAVLLMVWDRAVQLLTSEQRKLSAKTESTVIMTLKNNAVIHRHHAYLNDLMTKNNIPYCVLKGCSSAYYYPDPMLRTMGDVDFWVDKSMIKRAGDILESDGFSVSGTEHAAHITYKKEKMYYELHFDLAGIPNGRAGEILRAYFTDIFENSETAQIKDNEFVKASDFHHGIVLLLHTYYHWITEGIGLRHLCDLAVFFNHFTDGEFTRMYREKLTAAGIWRFTQIMGMLCHIYLNMPHLEWIGDCDEELCAALISDIFRGGNFGHKDKGRRIESMAISDKNMKGVGKNGIIQLIVNLNISFESKHPIFKNKFLHPFGFIPNGIIYFSKAVTGKRKLPSAKTLENINTRNKIYREFKLFEDVK